MAAFPAPRPPIGVSSTRRSLPGPSLVASPLPSTAQAQRRPVCVSRVGPDRPPRGRCLLSVRILRSACPAAGSFRTPSARRGAPLTHGAPQSLPGRLPPYANRVCPDHPPVATLQLPPPPRGHPGLAAPRRRPGEGPQVSPAACEAPASALAASTHTHTHTRGAATSREAGREWGRPPAFVWWRWPRGRCPAGGSSAEPGGPG